MRNIIMAKPVCLAIGVFLAISVISSGIPLIVRAMVGSLVAVFYFAPDLLLYNPAIKRQQEMSRACPTCSTRSSISIEAGLGFEAALRQGRQTGKGPFADELVRVRSRTSGSACAAAMPIRRWQARTTSTTSGGSSESIIQAEEHGRLDLHGGADQAQEMRMKRASASGGQGQQVSVKMLFPLMVCIFPVLFIVVLGPSVVSAYRIN